MYEHFEIHPSWKLADPIPVCHAAALIADYEPIAVRYDSNGPQFFENEHGFTDSNGIASVRSAFAVLTNAIVGRKLKATLRYDAQPRYMAGIDTLLEGESRNDENIIVAMDLEDTEYVISRVPNWSASTVSRAELMAWLESNGMRPPFFFPDPSELPDQSSPSDPDYLDKKHPRYAPKLAACIRAWLAVTDPGNRSPKQALDKWLREHAAELGLIDGDGKPVNEAIEQCCKVTNWRPGGGVPKTPG